MTAEELLEQRIRELTQIVEQAANEMIESQRNHQMLVGGLHELRQMLNRLRSEKASEE